MSSRWCRSKNACFLNVRSYQTRFHQTVPSYGSFLPRPPWSTAECVRCTSMGMSSRCSKKWPFPGLTICSRKIEQRLFKSDWLVWAGHIDRLVCMSVLVIPHYPHTAYAVRAHTPLVFFNLLRSHNRRCAARRDALLSSSLGILSASFWPLQFEF